MTECMLEGSCANAGSWKCQLCRREIQFACGSKLVHFPAFKDKTWYAKTVPDPRLEWLFVKQRLTRGATK